MDFSKISWKAFGMIVILLLLGGNAGAVPSEQWSKTFGGKESDRAFSVQQTRDKGYLLAGMTYSYGNGSADAWLIKVSGDLTPVQT